MPDFAQARKNMVDSQIHPMGVVNESVLEAYREIRREDFVPLDKRAVAYSDEDLPIAPSRYLMEPVTHARMVQAAIPVSSDTVLDIGGASGYSAAIFAKLASRVVAVERDAALLDQAEQNWAKLGLNNIMPHLGPLEEGQGAEGPYSLIFLNGAVREVPDTIVSQMAPAGRLLAVVKGRQDKIGRAMLITKNESGLIGKRVLFDASTPYLLGFAPHNEFVF